MYWTTASQEGCNNSSRQCCSIRGCCLMSAGFVFQVIWNFLSFVFLVLNSLSYVHREVLNNVTKVIIAVNTRAACFLKGKKKLPEGSFNKSTSKHTAFPPNALPQQRLLRVGGTAVLLSLAPAHGPASSVLALQGSSPPWWVSLGN